MNNKEAAAKTGQVIEKTHNNYVVFFHNANRIKFGITSNMKKRLHSYKQEAKRHFLGGITITAGAPQFKGIAQLVEKELRLVLRSNITTGHYEWLEGDYEKYLIIVNLTKKMQVQLSDVLFGDCEKAKS